MKAGLDQPSNTALRGGHPSLIRSAQAKRIRSEDWSQDVIKQAPIRLRALGDNSAALRGVP